MAAKTKPQTTSKPIKLGPNVTRWRLTDLGDWEATQQEVS